MPGGIINVHGIVAFRNVFVGVRYFVGVRCFVGVQNFEPLHQHHRYRHVKFPMNIKYRDIIRTGMEE